MDSLLCRGATCGATCGAMAQELKACLVLVPCICGTCWCEGVHGWSDVHWGVQIACFSTCIWEENAVKESVTKIITSVNFMHSIFFNFQDDLRKGQNIKRTEWHIQK